ncbi:MAG: GHMP kinase [Bacilli bacterium]|nr:GHMP kinase [Bacilli bacterium]
MVITKTPFRVSLCGGGSDLPAFYEKHGGCVISTTINKYMYITSHPAFNKNNTVVKYSKTESVEDINEIEHSIFRECLKQEGLEGLELTSIADIPQGTGLGSSSSFTVGLIKNLKCHKREYISDEEVAEAACDMEINKLGNPIGKQDQYAAAFGGLNYYQFNKDGSVFVEPVLMSHDSYKQLEKNLIMLYVGGEHSASEILKEQSKNVKSGDKEAGQKRIVELTHELKYELEHDNIDFVGKALHENWLIKKTLASGISNPKFDEWYDKAIKNGATGGKILGAGGSGFFLFYVPEEKQDTFRKEMNELPEMEFKFDHQGTTAIFVN